MTSVGRSFVRTGLSASRSLRSPQALVSRAGVSGPSHPFALVSRRWNSSTSVPNPNAPAIEAPVPGAEPQPIGQIEPRLSITFTCTAGECGHRSTHEFSKRAYTKGIVLVQCPSCKNRHLIADHLGWFKESTEEGTLKTVEDLLRARGEEVKTGRINFDGDIEYDGESK